MPVFEYIALNPEGKRLKGIVDAGSAAAARQKLRETEIYPVEIREAGGAKKEDADNGPSLRLSLQKVGLRDVAVMTRQLATLLGAGLPLVPSLATLVTQTVHPQLKKTLAQIREEVNEGNSLTDSMGRFPQTFPPFYINMVRAGEASGALNVVLERLADFSEAQQALRTKIRSALAYPVLMFFIGSGVLLFLVAFIVPNITKIFSEMHQNLPAVTVFLIALSGFLKSFWWLLAGALVAGVIGGRYAVTKTDEGRALWDALKLRAPLFGPIVQKMAVARFTRTLGTLLHSGVPMLTALQIAGNVVENRIIADDIRQAAREVEEGQPLSVPLSRNGLFPPMAIEMISVGEQSGNLEIMLYRIADAYEKEVEAAVMILTSLLEPIMILFMGLVVGFIVVSILLPIFEMNQLVR